jgi:LPS-assembly protein
MGQFRWELACPAAAAFAAPSVIRRLLTALLACLAVGVRLGAQNAPVLQPKVSADHEEFDLANNTDILTGHVQVDYGNVRLRADHVVINSTTRVATVHGHAELTRGPLRLLADTIVYHFVDGSYSAERLRIGQYPLYLTGRTAVSNGTTVTISDATVVVREPAPFTPTITANSIVYTPGKILQAQHAFLGIGTAAPVLVPKLGESLDDPITAHATFNAGFNSTLGAYVEAGLHVPVAPDVKLGGDVGIYSDRGVMFGPSGTYTSPTDPQSLSGYFRSGFIDDHGERKTDILGQPVPEDRAYVEWTHQQQLTENLSLTAEVNYWKDSEILRDFRPEAFFKVQEPDTYVESVYTGKNYFVSLFARFEPNKFEDVQQRLPELRFDLVPFALGGGIYEQFNASAAVLREDPPLGGTPLRSDRLDGYYALTRPINPTEWFNFTPIVGGRVTHYADTEGAVSAGGYTRTLGEVGFDAQLQSSGTFDYQNEQWKIDGLRHLLTPILSYRYVPEGDRGRGAIPEIDRDVFSTYLPPLGLADTRNIDDLHAINTLRIGLDNTIQTRDPAYGSRDLLVFNTALDLDFQHLVGQREVSQIHSELTLTPAPWLALNVYESFTPQNFTLNQFSTGLTLRDGDAWSVRFANYYLRQDTAEYAVEATARVNEVYGAIARLQYDARLHLYVEQVYGLTQNLGNTWRLTYAITLYDGPRRESKAPGFKFGVELLKF